MSDTHTPITHIAVQSVSIMTKIKQKILWSAKLSWQELHRTPQDATDQSCCHGWLETDTMQQRWAAINPDLKKMSSNQYFNILRGKNSCKSTDVSGKMHIPGRRMSVRMNTGNLWKNASAIFSGPQCVVWYQAEWIRRGTLTRHQRLLRLTW